MEINRTDLLTLAQQCVASPAPLIAGGTTPAWSPDGSRIALVGSDGL